MSEPADLHAARQRAVRRRAAGVMTDFDGQRLSLARRLAAMPRTRVSHVAGVTPAAITQFEKGYNKPTLAVVDKLSEALDVPTNFFRAGNPLPSLASSGAHFRSLRSTTSLERERALSFGELAVAVFNAIELHVELPPLRLPDLAVPANLDLPGVDSLAQEARSWFGLEAGPVPHMVRLLEAHGVIVVHLDSVTRKVDAFCHQSEHRPIVLLSPDKQDKARSRFDAAHELGHLLAHHDVEPGSRLVEQQAHRFAAEFLTPAAQIVDDLPQTLDWNTLHRLKKRWGVSLKALVLRAHTLGRFNDSTYRRGMRQLSIWGLPERGSLGPNEIPALLPRAVELLKFPVPDALQMLARETGLPLTSVERIWQAAGGTDIRPTLNIAVMPDRRARSTP